MRAPPSQPARGVFEKLQDGFARGQRAFEGGIGEGEQIVFPVPIVFASVTARLRNIILQLWDILGVDRTWLGWV